jgi:hypothetical protein
MVVVKVLSSSGERPAGPGIRVSVVATDGRELVSGTSNQEGKAVLGWTSAESRASLILVQTDDLWVTGCRWTKGRVDYAIKCPREVISLGSFSISEALCDPKNSIRIVVHDGESWDWRALPGARVFLMDTTGHIVRETRANGLGEACFPIHNAGPQLAFVMSEHRGRYVTGFRYIGPYTYQLFMLRTADGLH